MWLRVYDLSLGFSGVGGGGLELCGFGFESWGFGLTVPVTCSGLGPSAFGKGASSGLGVWRLRDYDGDFGVLCFVSE